MKTKTKRFAKSQYFKKIIHKYEIDKYDLIDKIIEYQLKNKHSQANELETILIHSIQNDKDNNTYTDNIKINHKTLIKHNF